MTTAAGKGLEGIVAANSGICWIDGEAGVLAYRGIDIHELAQNSTFEETTYLLWKGKLPTAAEQAIFDRALSASRVIDPRIIDLLRSFPSTATPMEILRTAVSALSFYDPDEHDNTHDANVRKSYRLTSQVAMLVAIYDRLRKGKKLVEADPSLSHAANFLWMLNGEKPSETAAKTLDIALILHADHELNASTFAARVIAATLSDIHSSVTGAIGALKGPLHGGANEAVMRLLFDIEKTGKDPVEYVKELLANKQKVMGFGHRVYKTDDPRSVFLRDVARSLGGPLAEFAAEVERTAVEVLAEMKPGRRLFTNVEFYAGVVMHSCGIPRTMFTPTFAAGRTVGWTTHVLEQAAHNRLIRPAARYTGPPPPQPVPAP